MSLLLALYTTHLICTGCNDGGFPANQLVGVQHDRYVAATMINSIDRRSVVAAYDYTFNDWSGVYLGAASGYSMIGSMTPVVAPYVKIGLFKVVQFGDAVALSVSIPITNK